MANAKNCVFLGENGPHGCVEGHKRKELMCAHCDFQHSFFVRSQQFPPGKVEFLSPASHINKGSDFDPGNLAGRLSDLLDISWENSTERLVTSP